MNARASAAGNSSAAFGATMAVFEQALFQATIAHDHAVRDADELGVRELDARPLIAIVEQHVDSRGGEFGIEAFCGFLDTLRLRRR